MSILSSDYENIYRVTFNEYTNCTKDAVSDKNYDIGKLQYIHIPSNGLLIRESEIDKYIKYGKGFASLECVGCLCKEVLK